MRKNAATGTAETESVPVIKHGPASPYWRSDDHRYDWALRPLTGWEGRLKDGRAPVDETLDPARAHRNREFDSSWEPPEGGPYTWSFQAGRGWTAMARVPAGREQEAAR